MDCDFNYCYYDCERKVCGFSGENCVYDDDE